MLEAAGFIRLSKLSERGGLPLRRLALRTHLPAVVGFALSLTVLCTIALTMTLWVEPRLHQLRQGSEAASQAHDAMLDQETGVRGYLATGAREFLEPYVAGKGRRTDANERMITALRGEEQLLAKALAAMKAQQSWQDRWAAPSVDTAMTRSRSDADERGTSDFDAHLREGKDLFDDYRTADAALQAAIDGAISASERSYWRLLMLSAVALGLIGLVSLLTLLRASSRLQRHVVAPVHDLTAAVDQIAHGNLDPHPIAPSVVDEVNALTEGVATMTGFLADRTAVARQREDALTRHGARLEHVLELSRGLSESLSLRYTSLRLLDAVRTLSGAEKADLWLRSRDRQELVHYDAEGQAGSTVALDPALELGNAVEVGIGAVGRAARYGRAIPLDESRASQDRVADASGIAIPLVVGSQVIGVLALRPPAGARLDLDLIDALMLQGASALQAAQLHGDVEEQSRKDSLTGLANRRQFDEDLAANVARAHAYGRPLALIMIDLDHFKRINDTYGHPRGDEVLQDIAGIIASQVRDVDVAYRYGGEELCVLMPEATVDDACGLAERLRARVEDCFPWASRSPVTLSAGVATLLPDSDGGALVGAADRALYAAKRNGRNRVERDQAAAPGQSVSV
jgi:diguanylate cyclase (GGDEF)-like protein